MTTIPVLNPVHRSARAISPNEFLDALRATCVPRFPRARSRTHHPIAYPPEALAISGGVDSMALAWLCSQIKHTDHWFRVADHPVSKPHALIIDHGMREGSGDEATNVAKSVGELGLAAHVMQINWRNFLGDDTNPNDLPNVETVARHLRYRRLGIYCRHRRMPTLLTAHHEDDQYETVLMRLLSGHGYRGMQGMRPATDIPECYDLHGVYQSGLIDDQRLQCPLYNMRPTSAEIFRIKREMRREVDPAIIVKEIEAGLKPTPRYLDEDGLGRGRKHNPALVPLEIEDGGVMIYRPLLAFGKDRLVATCLENGVPWFEDHTNADQTLTMRNAVRYMSRNHKLPVALQKPAILHLAERCRSRVATEEAEAGRLLNSVVIHEFSANAGTAVVTLPRFSFPTAPRRSSRSPASRQRRIAHYRHIAALLIRRLLSMVTPERELSQVAQLDYLVSMLFPSLAEDSRPPEPKPYVICGVHFVPVIGDHPLRWLLTRAPHVSNMPRPSTTFYGPHISSRAHKHPRDWKWPSVWSDTLAYDGRYWVSVCNRLPCQVIVAPFEMEHHKPFREGLADDQTRKDLSSTLKRYAPGKVRYTLPGLYASVDVSRLLAGGDWWPPHLAAKPGAKEGHETGIPLPEEMDDEIGVSDRDNRFDPGRAWERELRERGQMQLLALPTLGIALPGIENWLKWEVRYRKVDAQLIRLSKLGGSRLGRGKLRWRARFLYGYARSRRRN